MDSNVTPFQELAYHIGQELRSRTTTPQERVSVLAALLALELAEYSFSYEEKDAGDVINKIIAKIYNMVGENREELKELHKAKEGKA